MTTFATGKKAYAISDRSGQRFPYDEMVTEWNGSFVHTSEYEPKQPQLEPKVPGNDPQGLCKCKTRQNRTIIGCVISLQSFTCSFWKFYNFS
jgi:hypothetical protein